MYTTKCPECGGKMISTGEGTTLVGFYSPPGHNHDDNCVSRYYICENGHEMVVSKRNICPACDWKGKETCFCHKDKKVDEWPEEYKI